MSVSAETDYNINIVVCHSEERDFGSGKEGSGFIERLNGWVKPGNAEIVSA